MIKQLPIIVLLAYGVPLTLFGQQIKWMTLEEAVSASKLNEKKIMIDIYTSWCAWCQKMDQSTFQNTFIVNFVNQHFLPVRLDAEQQSKILFKGKEYNFVRDGKKGYHELAVELTLGRLSYPTIVFLDENLEVIQALRGFQSALRFEQIMTYFAQDYHKTIPWSKFSEKYQSFISHN